MESSYHNNVFLIMDNDSGYISNNLDQESNSNVSISLDNSDSTSTVEILRSFIPKPIYLSEDALLESPIVVEKSPEFFNSSAKSDKSINGFNFPDSEASDTSIVVPIADPIYFDMNSSKAHSSPNCSKNVRMTPVKQNVLANVTNTLQKSGRKRLNSSSRDTENTEPFKTPNKLGVKRKLNETLSPDLFSDEIQCVKTTTPPNLMKNEEQYVHKLDQKFLKKIQKHLSGIPPPPELTIVKISVDEMLKKLEENKNLFLTRDDPNVAYPQGVTSLVQDDLKEILNQSHKFPEILHQRHHGLHHNRSKMSEEIEHLCEKYRGRHIGAETQSTCSVFETKSSSPSKKSCAKSKAGAAKSPGRRLSHLARRRITFSCSNLQLNNPAGNNSRTRQILINQKKLELLNHRKSPRKTPNKSPVQRRTPSSSAKKKLRMRFRLLSGDFKETESSLANSKRALFQSPDYENKFNNVFSSGSSVASCSSFDADLRNIGTKRTLLSSPNKIGCRSALFQSPRRRNFDNFEKKRKRDEEDGENCENPIKLPRSQSTNLHENRPSCSFSRAKSDSFAYQQSVIDLSAAHKKKLQWAVYESLKLQNITTTHPQFKNYASVLARVTRRVILSSNVRLDGGGTSERMLRIAKHYSFSVVKGKTVEEIMADINSSKAKTSKPQGYVAPSATETSSSTSEKSTTNMTNSATNSSMVLKDRSNVKNENSSSNVKPESRIDRIRKVINF